LFVHFHSYSGDFWICRFIPWIGIEYTHFFCKTLVDTYLREYNKFVLWVVVHNFCSFPLC
jgi:hypothetical protein